MDEEVRLRPATPQDLALLLALEQREVASYNSSGYRDGARLRARLRGRASSTTAAARSWSRSGATRSAPSPGRSGTGRPRRGPRGLGDRHHPAAPGPRPRLGSAAQRLLADHVFTTTTAHRLQAVTNAANTAEQRALEAAGFALEGVVRGAEWLLGEYTDAHLYGRVRSDWTPPPERRDHVWPDGAEPQAPPAVCRGHPA